MVARWPRKGAVSETLLTGPVSMAVCWLMMRCGLAVSGQRLRRWLSQSRITWRVRSSSGRVRPAMVTRRLPKSMSATCNSRIV